MATPNNKFTPEIVDSLLDKLGTDDAFREQLLGDPASALGTLGLQVDPGSVPAVRKLPSKDVVQSNRAAIKSQIGGKAGMVFFFVE